jgi:predicted metal-dependent hydrolase
MTSLPYLQGYPPELIEEAARLIESGELQARLEARYPERHEVRSSKELYGYVQELKARHMRTAPPLGKVFYDDKLHVIHNALGLHATTTRAHGSKLKKRRELRVASRFKDAPAAFLRMIVVHELAHMKHSEHDRDFYKLCTYMEPSYHQLEFDLRLYLSALDAASGDSE